MLAMVCDVPCTSSVEAEPAGKRVPIPESVRCAHAPSPTMDLFNKEGLPASPSTATLAPSQKVQ
jgi:hypothetical protein